MHNYNKSDEFIKRGTKLLNNISKQNNNNIFLLDNLINDLYLDLLKIVPKNISRSASINSKNTFEYFLDCSTEEIKLILKENNKSWSLHYIVYPSYLDEKQKLNNNIGALEADIKVINLKDFYEKNVKKYYN